MQLRSVSAVPPHASFRNLTPAEWRAPSAGTRKDMACVAPAPCRAVTVTGVPWRTPSRLKDAWDGDGRRGGHRHGGRRRDRNGRQGRGRRPRGEGCPVGDGSGPAVQENALDVGVPVANAGIPDVVLEGDGHLVRPGPEASGEREILLRPNPCSAVTDCAPPSCLPSTLTVNGTGAGAARGPYSAWIPAMSVAFRSRSPDPGEHYITEPVSPLWSRPRACPISCRASWYRVVP